MKKLLVAILGIFMVLGTCLLSACDQGQAQLLLSSESVSVEVRSDEAGRDETIVAASVFGSSDYKLEVSANGYDEFLTVSTDKVSDSVTNIIIKGVSENDTPSVVTVRVSPGNIEKYIYVDVYSQIKSISQNFDSEATKSNYLVRGATTPINIKSLLTIEPAKARNEITWEFDGEYSDVSIEGNNVSIAETFTGDEIKLKAISSNGVVSGSIVLPVLDKIEENVALKWSYSESSAFEPIEKDNEFLIVSNLSSDEYYNGFVTVDYLGDLDVTGYAVDENGNTTDLIVVNRNGSYNGMPLFRIFAQQGKTNLNGQFKIGFKIGYSDYYYSFDTISSNPICVRAREKVNNIAVYDRTLANIAGSTQILYTEYVDSVDATSHGPQYHVSITPTTVIDASNKYSITVSFTEAYGSVISTDCPVEFWYRDVANGKLWKKIEMTQQGGDYVVAGGDYPTASTIYMKASNSLVPQSAEGIEVTFRSEDNKNIATSFKVRLVKAVSKAEFVFENGDFSIDSSENGGDIVKKKEFTIKGQTSVEGLYIISDSENVKFSDIQYVSSDEESVTFEVILTVNKSSYGITSLDSYQIAHKNGVVSEKMNIDLFLPLKDASVRHDSGENLSNSVTEEKYGKDTYLLTGEKASSTSVGISELMIRKDTTTPINYSFNSVNNYQAKAKITVGFFDFVETDDFDLEAFKALVDTKESLNQLMTDALANVNTGSGIAYFTNDNKSLITKGVGYTYAVLFFTGKAVENVDDDGNTTLVRIILIESYVSPNGISVSPDADKNVTLYSMDSLSSSESDMTRKTINIRFANSDVTYYNFDENIEIVSRNTDMGLQNINNQTITWDKGRYSLSNVVVTSSGISFNIEVISTFGELAFYDTLDVHYVLKNEAGKKIYDIYTPISITIKNAQRVEKLVWKNADKDGLYFKVGEGDVQYILLDTFPTNARNNNVHYIKTNNSGKFIDRNDDFVSADEISANTVAVNLSATVTKGMTGYIYLLPKDAVYNNEIRYYYLDENSNEMQGIITDSRLGEYKNETETYYDFLVTKAYFKSNATESNHVEKVSFAEILLKIKVNVADGKSFDHAYRIFDNDEFITMRPDRYYTVMNSLDLSGEMYDNITDFSGGLQGANEEITIKLNGKSFANTINEGSEIRNITFIGNVVGDGFVANVNNGKITNVTVDVDGICPSRLTINGNFGGGIVGTNNGTIASSSVLGLNIIGTTSNIGGIVGNNFGSVNDCRVEFYNLAVAGVDDYAVNTFIGESVGAIVGTIQKGSKITRTFAYNYALSTSSDQVLISTQKGAFAGNVNVDATPTDTIIDYSFAVVNIQNPYANYKGTDAYLSLTNYYYGYINSSEKYSVIYSEDYQKDSDFVSNGQDGFFSYVNGENEYHLKGLMQDDQSKNIDYNIVKSQDINGYYKSVAVDTKPNERKQGIMFFYSVGSKDLTNYELNDLNELNTISLAQLVGEDEIAKNIIVTVSDPTVVKVIGTSLRIMKTGTITLTLSSRQNVEINEEIDVTIIYAMSEMDISWVNATGGINYVQDDSILTLQKTRSRDFMVGYTKSGVYLGASTTQYHLISNDIQLDIVADVNSCEEGHTHVEVEVDLTSSTSFKITATDNGCLTDFVVNPKVFEDAVLQDAISKEFKRSFSLQPVDGVISFGVSGQSLPITPSINTDVKVEIKTTDLGDSIVPIISYKGDLLVTYDEDKDDGKIEYILPKDKESNTKILTVVVQKLSTNSLDKLHTIKFNVNFSVHENYQSNIAEDMDFEVYFESTSGNSSKDWNGVFTLSLTRQNFTNIDVQLMKVKESKFQKVDGKIEEVHIVDQKVAVLAPGNTAIVQVNVNPEFAYYDHIDFSYSFGEQMVLDAINMEVVKPFGESKTQYIRREIDGSIEAFSSSLRYTPKANDKEDDDGAIFFKIWINTTVQRDSVIKFTIAFKEADDTVLSYVNSYLTVSYLTQAVVNVDGADTAFLALGSSAVVSIDVLADQKVDLVTIQGDNVNGIHLSALREQPVDEVRGIRTYLATVSASILASATRDTFQISARVSRELNGSKEYKTASAEVVLVDFKLNPDEITISGAEDDNLYVWQSVPKMFEVEYSILPESYNVSSDEESKAKMKEINQAREFFLERGYYPATSTDDEKYPDIEQVSENTRYLINYVYENKQLVQKTLKDRLFYVVDNEEIPIQVNENGETSNNTSINSPIMFNYEDGEMSVVGLKSSGEVELVLKTYVIAGGAPVEYKKYFKITLEAYSDPDLPLTISDATQFKALNPEDKTNVKQNDYILTNDIILENYTAFDTKLIRSLDGNGYTIYIKSFNTELDSSTLNLALFRNVVKHTINGEEIPTTLKNIRVNLYNGGQLTINTNKYKIINIAGIAVENNGVITNSEVVSFYNNGHAIGEAGLNYDACTEHSYTQGINVKYVSGINTTEPVYHDGYSDWESQIAGFVINNNGSITNSRVGGDSIIMVGDEKLINDKSTGTTSAKTQELGLFSIIGQGNIAGFVLSNAGGYIASSYVKNLGMENQSKSTSFYASGFVGINNSSIITSYVEGVKTPKSDDEKVQTGDVDLSKCAREGSSIKSTMGFIAGFAYSNTGKINDSYSNILIANSIEAHKVYLASGFVYKNEGRLENCYSASQILNSNFTQMNFSGVSATGDLLATGEYINCYFFNKNHASVDSLVDDTTESRYSTGAVLIPNPKEEIYFYGFAIARGTSDGIWHIDPNQGIKLIEPNIISISHRYINYVDSNYEGFTAQNDIGEYVLPYAILEVEGSETSTYEIDTALGGKYNPILIEDAQDLVEVTGLSKSTYVQKYFNDSSVWGTYRIVNHIDLSSIAASDDTVVLPSSNKAFSGTLYGNGFEISGISMSNNEKDIGYGIFSSIESKIENEKIINPIVTNIELKVDQVIAGDVAMVGALAGYIKDSNIVGIKVSLNDSSKIIGLNFTGALAGLAFGNNAIKNIVIENPNVMANRYDMTLTKTNDVLTASGIVDLRTNLKNNLNFSLSGESDFSRLITEYSYAGGVIGYVDNYNVDAREFLYDRNETKYSINNVRVNGIIKIQGHVVGGAFGLLGYQTNIRDVGLLAEGTTASNSSYILSTKYYAGGIAGQSFGRINRSFAVHEQSTQELIEDSMASYYSGNTSAERGIINLFTSHDKNSSYSQRYIGGLVGYVGSGSIDISYSKLNVISPTATHAGGIIGIADVSSVESYKVEHEFLSKPIYTKFFINEVYATGDVRSKDYAGGIIGYINGDGSRISLLSVNALNYFGKFDYLSGKDIVLAEGVKNLSSEFKVNSLVGAFDKTVNLNNYKNYLQIHQADLETSEGGTLGQPSVAVYESYKFGEQSVKLSLFAVSDSGVNPTFEKLYGDNEGDGDNLIYIITDPSAYENSSVGYTYTQAGFLHSGVWVVSNWNHRMTELYPEIKYKENSEVLYLDCYNVAEVFEKMNGSNHKVVVRGRVSAEDETCQDIDLDRDLGFSSLGDYAAKIRNFSGILQGGSKTTDGAEPVKIIASRNFIDSTGVGFIAEGLIVEYIIEKSDESASTQVNYIDLFTHGTDNAGLFINNPVDASTLSNIKIILHNPVRIAHQGGDLDVGLIAPSIQSTNLNNILIEIPEEGLESTKKQAILSIECADEAGKGGALNAGIIAGSIRQSNSVSTMYVNNIEISNKANLIALSQTAFETHNIGGYFGQTSIGKPSQPLEINNLHQLNNVGDQKKDDQMKFMITNIKELKDLSINIGGYIGSSAGVSSNNLIKKKESQQSFANKISFETTGESIIETINAGGLFGVLSLEEDINLACPEETTFNTELCLQDVGTLHAGGLVGQIVKEGDNNQFNIGNIKDLTFNVTTSSISTTTSSISTDDILPECYIGGAVGKNEQKLNFNAQASALNLTHSGALSKVNYYVGGLVGSSSEQTKIDVTNDVTFNMTTSSTTTFESANIGGVVGYSSAQTNIAVTKDVTFNMTTSTSSTNTFESANIGGVVGYSSAQTNIAVANNVSFGMGSENKTFTSNAHIGGILGQGIGSSTIQSINQISFNLSNCNFNGADAYIGGVVGSTGSTETVGSITVGSISAKNRISEIEANVIMSQAKNLYLGGVVGKTASATIQNIDKVSLTAANTSGVSTPSQNDLEKTNYDNRESISITNEANVGIIAGRAESTFTFSGDSELNQGKNPIKLSSTSTSSTSTSANNIINFGSVLGSTCSDVSITGNIKSNAQVVVTTACEASLGGMIGNIEFSDTETLLRRPSGEVTLGGTSSGVTIGDEKKSQLIRFDGAFYTNVKTLNVGGMVGKSTDGGSSVENASLSVYSTSFGGAVKVYGSNSNSSKLTFGGTVGNISSTASPSITIKYNYNYGDVFVEYGNNGLETLDDESSNEDYYIFGGIIGNVSGSGHSVENNYTLTTSHNARQSKANACVNALFGSGGDGITSTDENYYNNGVVLASDSVGTMKSYSEMIFGDGDKCEGIIAKFAGVSFDKGHKLNPMNITTDGRLPAKDGTLDVAQFNGIKYYTMQSGTKIENNSIYYGGDDTSIYSMSNVAIIGDGNTVTYSNTNSATTLGFIQTLQDYSFVSGMVLNTSVSIEEALEQREIEDGSKKVVYYGTVVGTMQGNAILYGVQARGTIDVGGKFSTNVSGLVGEFTGGKIADCSTDIDITYRAGREGTTYGLTCTTGTADYKIIENSYVAGSITTMIDSYVYAFSNGNGATINSCYCIPKIDWNDYTTATPDSQDKIFILASSESNEPTVPNLFYDPDALNCEGVTANGAQSKTYTALRTALDSDWECDYNFNYGYPTLKHDYLKTSSYATRDDDEGTKQGKDGYDSHVTTYSYTRRENGGKPTDDDFYMVPNKGVFNALANICATGSGADVNKTINKNIVLLYDIDGIGDSGNSGNTLSGVEFDGNGKTITGLTSSLFLKISGGVRNLRLTDATTSTPLLAETLSVATISNMTLSGFITASGSIGALANTVANSTISTTTNLVSITVSTSDDANVGGLIGNATSTTINYCSNYGPINVTTSNKEKALNVGGLVGNMTEGSIGYSYNATSVTGGYATSSAMSVEVGTYKVGGLVGAGSASISNSYNSGMIKSGNKSNTKQAYAGGIVGYLESGSIETCYNEGAVEALGKNPEYGFRWRIEKPITEHDFSNKYYLELFKKEMERNVWAYGICCWPTASTRMLSSYVKLEEEDRLDETIFNNGNWKKESFILASWLSTELNIKDSATRFDSFYGYEEAFLSGHAYLTVWNFIIRNSAIPWNLDTNDETIGIADNDIIVTSVGKLGVPMSVIIKYSSSLNANYSNLYFSYLLTNPFSNYHSLEWARSRAYLIYRSGGNGVNSFNLSGNAGYTSAEKSGSFEEYVAIDCFNKIKWIELYPTSKISNNENDSTSSAGVATKSDIVEATRSNQTEPTGATTIKIQDTDYYLADSNNMNGIFNSGVYQYKFNLYLGEMKFLGDRSLYEISISGLSGTDWDAKIYDVKKGDVESTGENPSTEGVTIYYVINSQGIIEDDTTFNISVTANKEQTITFNTVDLEYYYVDDYSIGIKNLNMTADPMHTRYKLTTAGGEEYTTVYQIKDEEDEILYLAYDSNKYIFIPNAKLTGGENDETANSMSEDYDEKSFADKVKEITEKLANKTFYSRYISEASSMETITNFKMGKTLSVDVTAPNNETQSGTFSLYETITLDENCYSFESNTHCITIPTANIENDLMVLVGIKTVGDYGFFTEDTSKWGLQAYVAYDYLEEKWTVDSTDWTTNLTFKYYDDDSDEEKSYSVTFDDDNGVMEFTRINDEGEEDTDEEDTAFVGKFLDYAQICEDIFGSVSITVNKYTEGAFSKSLENKELEVYTKTKVTVTNSANVTVTDNGNGKVTIKPKVEYYQDSSHVSYNLGNVWIYYYAGMDAITWEYKKECQTTIISATLTGNAGCYFEILKDEDSLVSRIKDEGDYTYNGSSIELGFNTTISAKIYHTYKLDEEDLEAFEINVGDGYTIKGSLPWSLSETSESEPTTSKNSFALSTTIDGKEVSVTRGTDSDDNIATFYLNEDDDVILQEIGGKYTYYVVEDNKEENKKVVSETALEMPTEVLYSLNEDGEIYITTEKFGELSAKYQEYKGKIIVLPSGVTPNEDGTTYSVTDSYIAVDPGISIKDLEILRAEFKWAEFTMPQYAPLTVTYDGIGKNDSIEGKNHILQDSEKGTITLLLRDDSFNYINLEYNNNIKTEDVKIEKLNGISKLSIILTKDISFNNIYGGFSKADGLNIIGNGYYISYYGDSFYNESLGGFIKDVRFLGETNNSSLLVSKSITTIMRNIELYGSVTNNKDSIALVNGGSSSTITGLKNFASVQGTGESGVTLLDIQVTTEEDEENPINLNYGFIVAKDGNQGANGTNGTASSKDGTNGTASSKDGGNGTAGGAGAGIKAFNDGITSSTLTNQGILHSGNGGNGGSGGSSCHGGDFGTARNSGTSGNAGSGGQKGEFSGFDKQAASVSNDGYAGVNGATGRSGFARIDESFRSPDNGFMILNNDRQWVGFSRREFPDVSRLLSEEFFKGQKLPDYDVWGNKKE